jgi:hypothetical protein
LKVYWIFAKANEIITCACRSGDIVGPGVETWCCTCGDALSVPKGGRRGGGDEGSSSDEEAHDEKGVGVGVGVGEVYTQVVVGDGVEDVEDVEDVENVEVVEIEVGDKNRLKREDDGWVEFIVRKNLRCANVYIIIYQRLPGAQAQCFADVSHVVDNRKRSKLESRNAYYALTLDIPPVIL